MQTYLNNVIHCHCNFFFFLVIKVICAHCLKLKKGFRIENKKLKLFLLIRTIWCVYFWKFFYEHENTGHNWATELNQRMPYTHAHSIYTPFYMHFYIDKIILKILFCNLPFSFDTLLWAYLHLLITSSFVVTKADVFSSPSFWHFPNHLKTSITGFCVKEKHDFSKKSIL